jgi:hypothetical protein
VHGWAVPPPKLDGPLRKVAEREADDPEGNLTIVERGVRKRQRCFSCREYGWGGTAHISEQHPILYGKAIRKPLRHFGRPENTFQPITMRSERFHET